MSRANRSPEALNLPVFANVNQLWAWVMAETLARMGVREAIVSPGSRSTPLTMAFAASSEIEAVPVLDERSAGFFALGIAKQTRRPVVLVCTSGTAAANYLPAVIEASETGVPLILLTSDRPPELRDCHAGQTIDQIKLFGHYPVWQTELAVPEADPGLLCYLRQTMVHAVGRSIDLEAGPVHVNIPLRDPLPPIEPKGGFAAPDIDWADFFSRVKPEPLGVRVLDSPATAEVRSLARYSRGLIVAGSADPVDPEKYVKTVKELAVRLGWPVVADSLSPLRNYSLSGAVRVTQYDAILRHPSAREELLPDIVLAIGPLPISKSLRLWLEKAGPEIVYVSPSARNLDPLHGKTRHWRCDADTVLSLLSRSATRADDGYGKLWAKAEKRCLKRLKQAMESLDFNFEGRIAFELSQSLPARTPMFVANSMPVRDLEYFWQTNRSRVRTLFSRGANGIDGTLSTAAGIAHGGRPAILLTGDLALLHDTNGWLIGPQLRGSLTVILINNAGGGIFEMLPVSKFEPPFEKYFGTPQQVDFERLCSAYGVEHRLIESWASLRDAVRELPDQGMRVLEIRTDRKRDSAFRRELLKGLGA